MACFPSNKANVIMVAYGDCNSGVSPNYLRVLMGPIMHLFNFPMRVVLDLWPVSSNI